MPITERTALGPANPHERRPPPPSIWGTCFFAGTKTATALRAMVAAFLTLLFGFVGTGGLGAQGASATTPPGAASIGFYPGIVEYPQALRAGTFTEQVGLIVGGQASQAFHFATAGPIGSWLAVLPVSGPPKPLDSLVAKPGDTDLRLQLKVPAHAADGTYHGVLIVEAPPVKGSKGVSEVGLGTEVKVTADVTGTEVLAARLLDAYTYPKIEVGSPVTFFARVDDSGNVSVTPVFHLRVTRGKSPVFSLLSSPATLQPSSLSVLQVAWPGSATEVAPLGTYQATLSATFGHLHLGSVSTRFELVPFGSLHRGGELTSLKLVNRPAVGGYAEVQASVLSTGQAPEQTSFAGALYRNGTLVAPAKSQLPVILQPADRPGDTGTLTVAVPVKHGGSYRLTGVANFAGVESTAKTIEFRIGTQGLPATYEIAAAGAAVALLLVLTLALVLRGRRRRGPPPLNGRRHVPPTYTPTHSRALHVPPRVPVGNTPSRSVRSRRY